MQTIRSTVFIPLRESTDQDSQLLEVYSENQSFGASIVDEAAMKKDWSFVAATLRASGLYKQGFQAVSTVRKLNLRPPFWAIYQYFKKYAWLDNQRLYSQPLNNCEGDSGELGLAIALLLNASDSPYRYAIATGSLSNDKHADFDVAVEAVSSVPEKLDLLIEKRLTGAIPETYLYCFTPRFYIKDGALLPVTDLAQIKQLANLNIEVKPIAWLSEAQEILKAKKTRTLKQDKWLSSLFAAVFSMVLASVLYHQWLTNPIQIKPMLGKTLAEPFLVCTNRDSSEVNYYDLEHDGNTPLLPVFNHENVDYNLGIAWKLKTEKTFLSDQYYVAFIHLGEQSGYIPISKVSNGGEDITAAAGEELKWYWPMLEKSAYQEENVLIVVAQRTPIDIDALNQAFLKRFPIEKHLNILQARDFLLPQFPGGYAFTYKSVVVASPCK